MKRIWLGVALWACVAGGASTEAGPWRRAAFDASRGIVSSMAPVPGGTALGTSSGGLLLFDAKTGRIEPVTENGANRIRRVHALAWGADNLWMASDAGLHRWDPATRTLFPAGTERVGGAPTDIRSLAVADRTVWAVSSKNVWCFQPGRPETWKEWAMPIQDVPGAILRVGTRLLVGTVTKGLLVLDSASGAWVRLGRTEGLSSDQVVGLEWVGGEVYVATPEGIDVFDLSTQRIRSAYPGLGASWMTQSNGNLLLETEDGVLRIDPSTRKPAALALPEGTRAWGALLARGGRLTVAVGSEILDRAEPTVLGDAPMVLSARGFSLDLAPRSTERTRLQAFLRIPEWPDAKVPLVVELSQDRKQVAIGLPEDARGRVQVDLLAIATDSVVVEQRSLEGSADRSAPVLGIEPMRRATRDSVVEVRGKVSGVWPLVLVRRPGAVPVALGADGSFSQRLDLAEGTNGFRWTLSDGIGNVAERETSVRRDLAAPRLGVPPSDTVATDFARARLKMSDEGAVTATVRGPGQARVAVFDSFLVLEARMLSVGANQFLVSVVDEAGNASRATVAVVRTLPAGSPASSWALDGFRPFSRPVAADSTEMRRGVSVIRYAMVEGETLCGVAERFYGSQLLAPVLIQWNGFADSSQWRRMPVGTLVDIPVWRDVDHREPDVRGILDGFPWDRMPVSRRVRK